MALEKEFHASPPRCTRPGPSILKQQRSPASRQLVIEDSIVQDEDAAKPPIRKELLKGDTACGGGDSDKENVTGDGMLYCLLDVLCVTFITKASFTNPYFMIL